MARVRSTSQEFTRTPLYGEESIARDGLPVCACGPGSTTVLGLASMRRMFSALVAADMAADSQKTSKSAMGNWLETVTSKFQAVRGRSCVCIQYFAPQDFEGQRLADKLGTYVLLIGRSVARTHEMRDCWQSCLLN